MFSHHINVIVFVRCMAYAIPINKFALGDMTYCLDAWCFCFRLYELLMMWFTDFSIGYFPIGVFVFLLLTCSLLGAFDSFVVVVVVFVIVFAGSRRSHSHSLGSNTLSLVVCFAPSLRSCSYVLRFFPFRSVRCNFGFEAAISAFHQQHWNPQPPPKKKHTRKYR